MGFALVSLLWTLVFLLCHSGQGLNPLVLVLDSLVSDLEANLDTLAATQAQMDGALHVHPSLKGILALC